MNYKGTFKLNAKQLRKGKGGRLKGKVKKQEIYIVLDNVLDTYNKIF